MNSLSGIWRETFALLVEKTPAAVVLCFLRFFCVTCWNACGFWSNICRLLSFWQRKVIYLIKHWVTIAWKILKSFSSMDIFKQNQMPQLVRIFFFLCESKTLSLLFTYKVIVLIWKWHGNLYSFQKTSSAEGSFQQAPIGTNILLTILWEIWVKPRIYDLWKSFRLGVFDGNHRR